MSRRRLWWSFVPASPELLKHRPDLVLDADVLAPSDAVHPEILMLRVKRPTKRWQKLYPESVLLSVFGDAEAPPTADGSIADTPPEHPSGPRKADRGASKC